MISSGFITLAIHTNHHALALKSILEEHGIIVKLDNISVSGLSKSSSVRVKIHETDLAFALKIVESGDGNALLLERKLTGVSEKLLIPVDFSEMSKLAIHTGFDIARRLNLSPILLNAFASPLYSGTFPFSDEAAARQLEIDEAIEAKDLRHESEVLMRKLKSDVKQAQESGQIPKISFTTIVEEGVAEEVILSTTRRLRPRLIVMATRGKHKREKDLIGSVTAEVLDSCRVPVVTIPEHYDLTGIKDIKRLALFCNMDQNDLLVVDSLMRMFDYPEANFTVIPASDLKDPSLSLKSRKFCDYLNSNYKTATFSPCLFKAGDFRIEFEELIEKEDIQMIIVPNKKKNIFSRLFSPGIAHKLLFEKDVPMLAFPV